VSHQQDVSLPLVVLRLKVSDNPRLYCLKQYNQNRLDEQNSAPREQRSEEPASDAVEDLNDLTDEEVEQVYKGTVQESARSARR
jgi:hypothetical protein